MASFGMLALLLACASPEPPATATPPAATATRSVEAGVPPAAPPVEASVPPAAPPVEAGVPPAAPASATPEVVHLTTADGVALEADWYAGGATGVLLLHMIPPRFDRTSWPRAFVDGLREDGDSVLVLDRRGAGRSGGVAKEAYAGPNGALDADAAVAFLRAHGASRVVLIGASNGTTTALDWVAGHDADAVVWMSPGPYTVQNTPIAAAAKVARGLVLYPTSERDWPEANRAALPWAWEEVPGDAHGTFLFADHPEVAARIRAFVRGG